MNKILSIIVPSYNMEAYLPKCLGSLVVDDKELLQKLDVIVVNDGSKDRTSEIAHGFEAKYPQTFRVIDKQNGNYGSCINSALPMAIGKYVKILDADDSFNNTALPLFIKYLETTNSDLVVSDFVYVREHEDGHVKKSFEMLNGLACICDVPIEFCKEVQMQAVAYNRNVFQNLAYKQTEGISYTDQEWMFYPMSNVKTLSYVPLTIYQYLVGREGQTINREALLRNRWMVLDITQRFVDWLPFDDVDAGCEAARYLVNRLLNQLHIVYSTCLLDPLRFDRLDRLMALDKSLSEKLPLIYAASESFCPNNVLRLKFVRYYRKCNRADTGLMLRCYRALCYLKRLFE